MIVVKRQNLLLTNTNRILKVDNSKNILRVMILDLFFILLLQTH